MNPVPAYPPDTPTAETQALEAALLQYLQQVDLDAPHDAAFHSLARQVFAFQLAHNRPYRRFCTQRGMSLESFHSCWDAPPVATDVFKAVPLTTFPLEQTCRTFRTSGTTQGQTRGQHHFCSLSLYQAALRAPFFRYLLPDGARLPLLALLPSPAELPDSSLSFMAGELMEQLAVPGSRYYLQQGELLTAQVWEDLSHFTRLEQPVLLLGTAFALVHLFDQHPDLRLRLPPGSRVMETGGLKGRAREVSREELYALLQSRLGLLESHIVAEYGMTELSSQLYDRGLHDTWQGRPFQRALVAPPWLKVAVVDPQTFAPLPMGESGLVRFFDLANLHSVSAILTADLGVMTPQGLTLFGRAQGAEARGCSLTVEELLLAQEGV